MIKSFSKYLTEGKNTHLEHIEDEVWNEGSKGVDNAINFLENVIGMLSGNSSSAVDITTKWDGAPAVFCGINPENGKFFVGTKSVFNRGTPKINYTDADIDANHSGDLAAKLKMALKYLPKLNIQSVLQGDLMFTSDSTFSMKVDGQNMLAFRPNTITYAFPADSDNAKEVKAAKLGIVFHTRYVGKSMDSMKAVFDPQVRTLKKTKDVWFRDADFKDESGTVTLTAEESDYAETLLGEIKSVASSMKGFIDEIYGFSKLMAIVKIYVNDNVKSGGIGGSARGLIGYFMERYGAEIEGLKSEKGKESRRAELEEIVKYLNDNADRFDEVFELTELMSELKIMLVRKLEKINTIGTFIQTEKGLRSTAPEGFVAVDRISNKALKLVDRLEFSRSNFTVAKNWVK
jgi:hypothetical protein